MIISKGLVIMRIGKRLVKSLVAMVLCFTVAPIMPAGAAFYSSISALQCLQVDSRSTKVMAMGRTMGTLIGAFYGICVQLLGITGIFLNGSYLYYLMVSLVTVMVLHTASVFNYKSSAYFGAVVFLSITVVHRGDAGLMAFVASRVSATMVGVAIGIGVNSLELPRHKQKDVLLVSGLEGTLFKPGGQIGDATRIVLNRMIEQGAMFTIASLRTPASIIEAIPGINLNLPVVACNGAVLYDIKQNRYLKSLPLNRELGETICDFLKSQGLHVFANCLIDNVLVIHYGKFNNPVEASIFEKCRTSPYRNYIHESHYIADSRPLYYMVIEQTVKLQAVAIRLKNEPFASQIKVLFYPSGDHPGYSYLKIYRNDVSKKAMLDCLQQLIKAERIVTCGSVKNYYDICIEAGDFDTAIKRLDRVFKPLGGAGISKLQLKRLIFQSQGNIMGKTSRRKIWKE